MPPLSTFDKTLIALALSNSIVIPVAQAETINVDGSCTLQDAIRSANTDTSVSGCEEGDAGLDIIDIPTQTITLTSADVDGYQYGDSGLPLVTSEITIQGNGSTIQANNPADCYVDDCFRIIALEYYTSAQLTFESITLTGGKAVYYSGGIYGYGGAVFVGEDTSLTLSNTKINGNEAGYDGGAIYAEGNTTVQINNSTLSNNTSAGRGGALSVLYSGDISIYDSTISTNTVTASYGERGGGVYAYRASLSIVNSTISMNNATSAGSGLYLNASSMSILNSTISNNLFSPSVQFIGNDTFYTYGTFINTVVANSQDDDCAVTGNFAYSVLTTTDNNWFEDSSCDGSADGDPGLGPLQGNGGPTLTHAPQTGSGLIGAGLISACTDPPVSMEDQRGEARGLVTCFIGAVEGVVDEPSSDDDDSFFVVPIPGGKAVIFSL